MTPKERKMWHDMDENPLWRGCYMMCILLGGGVTEDYSLEQWGLLGIILVVYALDLFTPIKE